MQKPQYERLPQSFLKGIFLAPHNFSSPQNPIHGQMVDFQLKNDLYQQSFRKIQSLQFSIFDSRDSYLKLEQIKECSQKQSYAERIKDHYKFDKQEDEIIACEQWTINNSGKKSSVYKLKYVQSKTDRFYSMIYPPRWYNYLFLEMKGEL